MTMPRAITIISPLRELRADANTSTDLFFFFFADGNRFAFGRIESFNRVMGARSSKNTNG